MNKLHRALALFLLVHASFAAKGSAQTVPMQRAETTAATLQTWYVARTGLYESTGWWNAANATTTLIDLMRAGGLKRHEDLIANTFTHAQVVVPNVEQTGRLVHMTGAPGFLNDYYDDEGWWALAWIDAYDLTGEQRYLAMAESIFANMTGGWDATCGGGIWWSKQRTYKNAIANELFFSVATHLATRVTKNRADYTAWAGREWLWFQSSGMINREHLVNDGLTTDKTSGACTNNERTVWTYNQGVILGALTEWSRVNADPGLLVEARVLADAGLTHLTDHAGVLHDVCEPSNCGADAPQFKGIFVRNLRALNSIVHEARYTTFFHVNAESVWRNARSSKGELGLNWSGPVLLPDAATQSSALDVLVATLPEKD